MRGDNKYDKDIFCPFFKGTKKMTIKCEGPYKSTAYVQMTYYRLGRMERHIEQYCKTANCEKCRVYRAAMEKYDEEK